MKIKARKLEVIEPTLPWVDIISFIFLVAVVLYCEANPGKCTVTVGGP
ncbi:MAG: hypothetical protein WDA22_02410 [Bacteroidota bacterium]